MGDLDKLFNSNRLPAFFVGSGISKRYLNEMPNWDDLLISIVSHIGISPTQYYGLKQNLTEDNKQMPKLASTIERMIRDKVVDGTFNIDAVLSENLKKEIPKNTSFLKLLVAQKLANTTIKTDSKTVSEIKTLKKLISKINNIFTTNFDMFFETYIFEGDEMVVFDNQESLYFSPTFGISEMYKIHGSIKNPKTIIITENDYDNYLENMNIFVSKLYNTLMERPLVFLGYSLNDPNILRILEGFIKHFSTDNLNRVTQNLIFIEYSSGVDELLLSDAVFQVGSKQIVMKKIKTDNYEKFYNLISTVKEAISAREIKRYKDIVYDVIANHEKNGEKVFVVNALDINKIDSNKMVLGIHPKYDDTLPLTGLVGLDAVKFIEHALFNNINIKFEDIATIWAEKKLGVKNYFPIYFIKKNCNSEIVFGERFNNNLKEMNRRYKTIITDAEKIKTEKLLLMLAEFNELKNKPVKDSVDIVFLNALLLLVSENITIDDIREFLTGMYKKNKDYINNTNFKKAVCYLDYYQTETT